MQNKSLKSKTITEGCLVKRTMQFFHRLSERLFLNTDFKNNAEFKRKYTAVGLQRAKLFNWLTFVACLFSFFLDIILKRDATADVLYRQTLLSIHIAGLVCSFGYIIIYRAIEKSERYRLSYFAKAAILSEAFLTLLTAAAMSFNSQRYTGNIDAYVLVVLVVALVVPMYPKWILGIYGFVHICFAAALLSIYQNSTIAVKIFNSTTTVLVALVLFLIMYRYNVKNFLNEEMLKEDKATFIKLFEINPFPLVISRFEDGKIQYANQRAMLFYEISKEQCAVLHHRDLYENISDLDVICNMLEIDGKVNDYVVEQKTLSGQVKCAIVNYELIDYFGERAILSGVADISEIRRMEHELTINASMDSLTGVLNRRVGMDFVRRRLEAAQHEKTGFQLCFFDMDNLKMVNDQFGHVEGDAFIVDVCRIIGEEIKPNDTMFRYGGDEFIILFHTDDEQEAEGTRRRIAQRFETLNGEHYKPYPINASMGIFSYRPEMDLNMDQMIAIVDQNMYEDKLKKK